MTDSRINMRISTKNHEEIKAAAQLAEQDLTTFMVSAALEKAERLVAESNIFKLTAVEYLALERALSEPVVPNPRLRELLKLTKANASLS
ncbi:DUF1778 domain-containing protein [Candidatus Aquiluna sp. UB-MaderosW2red]|uniref:type II toxin-antitoxin system TacA family antitoxin n=1 Tax=Candidatus Aquiluna sp. UB-MaderosW2red TaxID=1855377 RepID=UPI000875D6AB|nr:DUF1778 domain-containing protein [Candidatus Aquiluna sp. UB-MaderosW2red]SCX05175.1 Uncharacterized conserved protein, DUF1778 family [Candidatus Aquiluna sp. UB-MaderosW2red]